MKTKLILSGLMLAGAIFSGSPAFAANGATVFGITSGNTLVRFNSETPSVMEFQIAITGLQVGEVAVAIDFRPSNNTLYLLGSTDTLYTVNLETAAATAVGSALSFSGTKVGIDFNPVADALRVVSEADENARINANTGALISNDTALAYDAGDVNSAVSPTVTSVAYTSNSVLQSVTTLFGIDTSTNSLVRQGSPNGSPVSPNSGTLFTIGGLGVDASDSVGFDITEAKDGSALASIIPAGESAAKLYSIDLGGGHATLVGTIGATAAVTDIAVLRAGAVRLDQATYTVGESAGTLSFTVERVGGSANGSTAATVLINTTGFTATSGVDYTPIVNHVVTFAEGEVSKTLLLTITNDSESESPETLTISLSSPTGGLVLADSGAANVTITDDEAQATPTPTPTPTVTPGGDDASFQLSIDVNKKLSKSQFLSKGLAFKADCDESCTLNISVRVSNGIAKRFGLSSTVLATKTVSISGDGEKRVTIKPSSSVARRLLTRPGAIPVTLRVIATDSDGNTDTVNSKVVIK